MTVPPKLCSTCTSSGKPSRITLFSDPLQSSFLICCTYWSEFSEGEAHIFPVQCRLRYVSVRAGCCDKNTID